MKRIFRTTVVAMTALLGIGIFVSPVEAQTSSANANKLQNVRVLYGKSWRGDQGFARRIRRELSEIGLRWTNDPKRADAWVYTNTDWTKRGFTGHIWLRDRNGKLLWHETALRPNSSNRMASTRLTAKLRAALKR